MINEVYSAVGFGAFINVSATAKSALNAPATQAALVQAKTDIHSLVTGKKIQVENNMHLLLGTVNPAASAFPTAANGNPVSYHNFDTLQIRAIKLS